MTNKYYGFNDFKDLLDEFHIDESYIKEDQIIFASYENHSYEGDAIVLFKEDGKIYTVECSHCSCSGLEDGWDPEETCVEALKKREWFCGEHADLVEVINNL